MFWKGSECLCRRCVVIDELGEVANRQAGDALVNAVYSACVDSLRSVSDEESARKYGAVFNLLVNCDRESAAFMITELCAKACAAETALQNIRGSLDRSQVLGMWLFPRRLLDHIDNTIDRWES